MPPLQRRGAASVVLACALVAAAPTVMADAAATIDIASARSTSASDVPRTGTYTATTPTRLTDTRVDGTGSPIRAGNTRSIRVLGGNAIPSGGVSAVMINVTAVPGADRGLIKVYPSGGPTPKGGALYFKPQTPVSNQILVPVGIDGLINVYASGTTHIVVDVQGWVGMDGSPVAGKVSTIDEARLLDTRTGLGGYYQQLVRGALIKVKVAGVGIVPSDASAVILNVSAFRPGSDGSVAAFATGRPDPDLPILSTQRGRTRSIQAMVPVGTDGTVTFSTTSTKLDLAVDVEGYVNAATAPVTQSGNTHVVPIKRLRDTRNATGRHGSDPLARNEVYKCKVAGLYGVPPGAQAVSLHVTIVSGKSAGNVQVMPFGGLPAAYSQVAHNKTPSTAVLFPANRVVSNTVTLPVGPDGSVFLRSNVGQVHAIVDLVGWTDVPDLTVTRPIPANVTRSPAAVRPDTGLTIEVLTSANKYAMGRWWTNDAQTLMSRSLKADAINIHEDPVRRLAAQSFSLATALATNVYDPVTVGVSTDVATQRTIQLIDHVSARHIANDLNGWGGGWQGSLWSGYAGRAAWLLWDKLPPATQARVAKMIYFEANDSAGKEVNYYRDRTGGLLNAPGDTGSDDTSWWAMPLQLASVMFPRNSRQPVWKYSYVLYAIAAWAKPADVTNGQVVNGQAISRWISGSNVEPDGIVYNHGRIAPDYMTLMYQTMDDVWVGALAGEQTPRAAVSLVGSVYDAYTNVRFSDRTIYTPGSSAIYYPEGIDYGPGQQIPYALVDAQAEIYGIAGDNATADQYKMLHLQAARDMQKRYTDGHMHAGAAEYSYAGREEHVAQLAAQLLLTIHVRDKGLISFTDQSYVVSPNY